MGLSPDTGLPLVWCGVVWCGSVRPLSSHKNGAYELSVFSGHRYTGLQALAPDG
ncbi:hypothetical protein BJY27_000098 [Streptomyces rapamycinicus]|uniref:Uncharacterized protein n=2 Tax=Streptomyces rapamycinicus TaxID=1226757 RepID=A0A3L8R8T5_STRRN|nr:hypothetical protein [Streptomyces rapamycinicus]RLV76195.1 hypothetical protein D3C57_143255 [Streptomyces rapamycinicus NRRL 5491]